MATIEELYAIEERTDNFLGSLYTEIIQAVCIALEGAELTAHVARHIVSNIQPAYFPVNDWLHNRYRMCGIRLPEYVLFDLSLRSMFKGYIA